VTTATEDPPGVDAFPDPARQEFEAFLAVSNNRTIFDFDDRDAYRRHLRNPLGMGQGRTHEERVKDRNRRSRALKNFCLEQEQLYQKAGKHNGTLFQQRYVACHNDAFDIICDSHRYMLHGGKLSPLFFPTSILHPHFRNGFTFFHSL
jgi:hypothetical protein